MAHSAIEETAQGVEVRVHVQPNASKSEVAGFMGDRLKLRVRAKPVEGAANEAARKLLARVAGVSKSQVSMIRGAASRRKDFRILCDDPGATGERLRRTALPEPDK